MRRVLAVKDQQSVLARRGLEETLGKLLLVTEVQCTFNVSTIVFVLEAAVNDDLVVIQVIISTIQHFYQCLVGDARETLWLSSGEVGKLESVGIIDIHHRLEPTGLVIILFLLGIHYFTGAFEHA